ncbi:hypothetical protein GCM10010123_36930 [Pilimelia anulata]|uniref:Acyl transferase domain-containing protein n=1 Tax=Pilimelia anulata TaxID=53371 RepID=A0A8J3B8R4_9ACTN|nr:type I polyketide synthase [Pilimelia anulata]GGK03621.1 hypothetical protein GCM10010123_36930 [Pilimelia anulata]
MTDPARDPVAVIGMSGRFPGADSVEEFWRNLVAGADVSRTYTDRELVDAGLPADAVADPTLVRTCYPLAGPGRFAADFFGVGRAEAEVTDPQHRLFLECCWTALEDAGYPPGGPVGVFAAASATRHHAERVDPSDRARRAAHPLHVAAGGDAGMLALRVSYKLRLTGPSLTVQTACSSSLVAVHLAARSLRARECAVALAGGASVRLLEPSGVRYEPGGILAPDGRCRAFDAAASGTASGDGAAVVVLKRLADALADGDHVYAVLRGSAVNNDGAAKVGLTAPSAEGQAAVLRAALADAGVDPATIGYVEAHGTGTALGDPIELRALRAAYGSAGACTVGAVKASIGHLDAAAGIAGLVKAVLAVDRGYLPGTPHFRTPNPALALAGGPFRISGHGEAWGGAGPRRAGVSAFGMGGTNAHVIVEQAPERAVAAGRGAAGAVGAPAGAGAGGPAAGPWVLPLSAHTADELAAAAGRLADRLDPADRGVHADHRGPAHDGVPSEHRVAADRPVPADYPVPAAAAAPALGDAAWTLWAGRARFGCRRAVVAADPAAAAAALRTPAPPVAAAADPTVVYLLAGQGSRYAGAGSALYAAEPAFRDAVDECAAAFAGHGLRDVRELLLGADEPAAAETLHAQPAVFTLDYACARLLGAYGVTPGALLGHSLGELAGACLAGVLDLAGAARLVAARSRLMQDLPPGGMLAVALPEHELLAVLGGQGTVAAVNAPDACVVAGADAELPAIRERLAAAGAVVRELPVRRPFHTAHTEPARAALAAVARGVRLLPPRVRLASNVTGDWLTDAQATDPAYWAEHLRRPVRFAAGVAAAAALPDPVFVEVGPAGLAGPVRAMAAGPVVRLLPRAGTDPAYAAPAAVARLWEHGVEPDPAARRGDARRTPLPTYPFARDEYLLPRVAPAAGGRWTPVWFPAPPPRPRPALRAQRWLVVGGDAAVPEALAARGDHAHHAPPPSGPDGGGHGWAGALVEAAGAPERLLLVAAGDARPAALTALVGALRAARPGGAIAVDVVTPGLYDVAGAPVAGPGRAALHGVAADLADRYPGVRFHFTDTDGASADGADPGRLLAEWGAQDRPTHVAYRGGRRFGRAHVPLPAAPGGAADVVVPGAGYLVTGASRPLGVLLAEQLAAAGARLALVGDPDLPDPADPAAAHPLAARLGRLLAARPGAVTWASADPADPAAVREAVAAGRAALGRIRGALHAADPPPAAGASDPTAPGGGDDPGGTAGARLVAELLAADAPDFLVLTTTGGDGAALGALAAHRTAAGLPTVAVRTGDGIATAPAAVGGVATAVGADPAGIAAAAWAAVRHGAAEVVVGPAPTGDRGGRATAAATDPATAAAPGVAAAEPADPIAAAVAEIWREVLGVPECGPDDDFHDLGGNSLFAMQIVARLRDRYGDLPLSAIFEAPTVAGLAAAIRVRQAASLDPDELDALLREIEAAPAADEAVAGGGRD